MFQSFDFVSLSKFHNPKDLTFDWKAHDLEDWISATVYRFHSCPPLGVVDRKNTEFLRKTVANLISSPSNPVQTKVINIVQRWTGGLIPWETEIRNQNRVFVYSSRDQVAFIPTWGRNIWRRSIYYEEIIFLQGSRSNNVNLNFRLGRAGAPGLGQG